jgi:hypothetical protein
MAKANRSTYSPIPFDSPRKPEGRLPLKKKASDLSVLILLDSDKKGSATPVTSG